MLKVTGSVTQTTRLCGCPNITGERKDCRIEPFCPAMTQLLALISTALHVVFVGNACARQTVPDVELISASLPDDRPTATNLPAPNTTRRRSALLAEGRGDHAAPSDEVSTVPFTPTATKVPLPK